jgi:hypothetical protein
LVHRLKPAKGALGCLTQIRSTHSVEPATLDGEAVGLGVQSIGLIQNQNGAIHLHKGGTTFLHGNGWPQFCSAFSAWASFCWLWIGYGGAYMNFAGAILGGIVFGNESLGQEIVIHIANIVLWPTLVWFATRLGRTHVTPVVSSRFSLYIVVAALLIGTPGSLTVAQDVRDSNSNVTTSTLLGYVPEKASVVITMPGDFLFTDPISESATPVSRLGMYVAAHASGSLESSANAAPVEQRAAKDERSPSDDAERFMIALMPNEALDEGCAGKHKGDALRQSTRWQGVVLVVPKGKTSASQFLHDFGFSRKIKEFPHVLAVGESGRRIASTYAGVLSERIAILGFSASIVENCVADAGNVDLRQRRADIWNDYRIDRRDAKFWVARKSGARVGGERIVYDVGFCASSDSDDSTVYLTYVFKAGEADNYAVGAEIWDGGTGPFYLVDRDAHILIDSIKNSNIECEVRLDNDRGMGAAMSTIRLNLGIASRVQPGETKSP